MWKLLTGISLTLCSYGTFATADETVLEKTESEPSVSVECHGRLRHGVVAIGCETTGTTITFNRMTWELQFPDDAGREFAKAHHKEPVVVTGVLRRLVGTEEMVRWIIDVKTLSAHEEKADLEEGTQLTIRGMLRATDPRTGNSDELTIDTNGQVWHLDLSSEARLQEAADSLIGRPVLLTGSLKQVTEEVEQETRKTDSPEKYLVRVKNIRANAISPIDGRFFR